jgi:hypothetical protein
MNETESISQPQAAKPSAPPQKPEVVKPRARRVSGFLAVAILVLFGGTMLLMLQGLRAGNASEARIADIARDVAALNRQTEGLNARLAALERSSAETQSVSARLADLNMRLAAVESDVSRAADRDTLAQLQGRIARLETTSPGEMFRTATAALARANLARAAEGSAPLDAELNALRAAAPDDPALAIVQPMAQTGVPTRLMLIARFPAAARTALEAERAGGADDNFFARLWTSLRGLVRVRRLGDLAGTTTQDRLARAQADCDRGDLAGAAMETRAVSAAAAMPLESWLKDADARLSMDDAIAAMNLRIVRALAAPAPSVAPP